MPPSSIATLMWIDATGYHLEPYPAFLAWIQSAYQFIYGADVYIDPDSMDGQWLALMAQAFYDTGAVGLGVYQSFSPTTAQGYGLSRNVKINGLKRDVPTSSTVGLNLVGVAGTVITNGIAVDTLNQQWLLPPSVTLDGGGNASTTGTAPTPPGQVASGAVFAAIGTVTGIFTPTNGWQTVTNPAAAVPGDPIETDAELRIRQSQSTSIPALTVIEATQGALQNVPGVSDCVVYENDSGVTDGNGIPPYSVCAVIAGSFDYTTVAETIQKYKTPGVPTFGNESVNLVDSRGVPITISFTDVAAVSPGADIQVAISLTKILTGINPWSDNYQVLIKNSVAAAINSLGIGALSVNGNINFLSLVGPAYLNGTVQGQSYVISALTIGINGFGTSTSTIPIDFDQRPECDPSVDVTLTIT